METISIFSYSDSTYFWHIMKKKASFPSLYGVIGDDALMLNRETIVEVGFC